MDGLALVHRGRDRLFFSYDNLLLMQQYNPLSATVESYACVADKVVGLSTLDDGVLSFDIDKYQGLVVFTPAFVRGDSSVEFPSSLSRSLRGSVIYDALFSANDSFYAVDAIRGQWLAENSPGVESVPLRQFRKGCSDGLSDLESAAQTFSGRMAFKYGFLPVDVCKCYDSPGLLSHVDVLFQKS